ncbi:hypothetical protein V8C34DRAFT_269183 [Trichoderma compactum]
MPGVLWSSACFYSCFVPPDLTRSCNIYSTGSHQGCVRSRAPWHQYCFCEQRPWRLARLGHIAPCPWPLAPACQTATIGSQGLSQRIVAGVWGEALQPNTSIHRQLCCALAYLHRQICLDAACVDDAAGKRTCNSTHFGLRRRSAEARNSSAPRRAEQSGSLVKLAKIVSCPHGAWI